MNTMLFTLPRYPGMSRDFEFAPFFHRLTLMALRKHGCRVFILSGDRKTRKWIVRTIAQVFQGRA